jgi:cell wall-associated NlpC family hydrolase
VRPVRTSRALRLVAAGAVVALGGVLLPGTSASADPSLDQLRRRATALRVQLDRLGVEQDLAVQRYDAADEALQQATTAELLATAALDDQQRAAAGRADVAAGRVRALYQSGGPVALTFSVLDSPTLDVALARWNVVQTLVGDDRAAVDAGAAGVAGQRGRTLLAAQARARTVAQQAAADAAAAAVQGALRAQAQLVASTDSAVVALAAAQQRAALAAAQAQARELAAAQGITSALGQALPGQLAGGQAAPDVPAPSAAAAAAVAAALGKRGSPYVWGATGPSTFDCSGLTQWAYAQAGVAIPRVAAAQYLGLPKVALSALAPGDLVFYATDPADPQTIHHVAMYLGAGLMVNAPHTGDVVRVGPVGYGQVMGAVRPSPAR